MVDRGRHRRRHRGRGQGPRGLALPGNYGTSSTRSPPSATPGRCWTSSPTGRSPSRPTARQVAAIVFSRLQRRKPGRRPRRRPVRQAEPGRAPRTSPGTRTTRNCPTLRLRPGLPRGTGGLGRTYQYFTGTPTYPFGYGLSYTTFAYSHVRADRSTVNADGRDRPLRRHQHRHRARSHRRPALRGHRLHRAGPWNCRKRLAGFAEDDRCLQPGARPSTSPVQVSVPDLAFHDGSRRPSRSCYNGTYRFEVGPDAATTAGSRLGHRARQPHRRTSST